ncbi:hypothetical protein DESC_780479 [Desulfosarcina cetonica]|nr:hypothetical protein DESC_780479 [Desulfosarcina cetonica]
MPLGQTAGIQQPVDRADAVLVQLGHARELVGMATMFDDQRPVDEIDGIFPGDAQPQIVVLTGGQGRVEQADLVQQGPPQHHRRRAHQTQGQAALKNHAARLAMPLARIDAHAVSNPDFLGLADSAERVVVEKGHLGSDFTRQPGVVRIQKGDQIAAGGTDTGVTGRADPLVGLADDPDAGPIGRQTMGRVIGGPVIDHDQLQCGIVLAENRVDGMIDRPAPVVGGQNDTDPW